tara:strand:+ start:109 stop:1311 length:1203 start_codon:yes stop_codon:yes gene_type:complete
MHVFIITQYYPPEIGASASRWSDYTQILLKQNHKVTVLCEAPHYPHKKYYPGYKNKWCYIEKRSTRFTIVRSKAFSSDRKSFFKKISHYLVFMLSAIVNSKKIKDFDLLIISSPPLFTGIIGLHLKYFRGKKYWLDVRDLWPDSALELNQINNGFFYKIGKKMESRIYKSAEGFIFPVPSFKKYLKNFSKEVSKKPMIELVNGVSSSFLKNSKSQKISTQDKFIVLYSGNMGLAQDLKTIIKAAKFLKSYNIYFKFIGDGVCKSEIEILAKPFNKKIEFCEPMPRDELIKHILKSSVCLVPLKDKKIFNSALPSKMFEYMACGKPIIASVRGDAKKVINDSGSGIAVHPENAKLLSNAILTYFNDSKRCKVDGKNGMTFVTSNLSKEVLISSMLNKIKSE